MPARPPVAIPDALAGQHLARLRDTTTPAHAFRRHAGALSPFARASALVPARRLLPDDTVVGLLGMVRDEGTLEPGPTSRACRRGSSA